MANTKKNIQVGKDFKSTGAYVPKGSYSYDGKVGIGSLEYHQLDSKDGLFLLDDQEWKEILLGYNEELRD